jgi:PAS domain S-box-containing protein
VSSPQDDISIGHVREALSLSEERFRLLVEGVKDYAIFMLDPHGRVATWNRGAERIKGYRAEEIIGEHFSVFYTDEDLERNHPEQVLRMAAEGAYEEEGLRVRKDGSTFWANIVITALRADGGNLRGFTKVTRDITERKRAEDAQRFLAEAGDVLSSSLDYRTTLASVARLAVPTLADWSAVDVLEGDGSVERLAVEHTDPEKVALAYELEQRYPPDPDAPRGLRQVLRTGEPEMMSEIPQELLDRAAHDEEHRKLLRKLDLRSYMVVPLVARGRTLGAISLVYAESGRRYGEADLALAEELARRAALAVDNARLYNEAQREIAERKRAQEELRRSRDELEIILRGVADGIIAQDAGGRVFYANEAAARMSGYPSAKEFVEAPADEVMNRFELLDEGGQPFPLERLPGHRALKGEVENEVVLRFRVVETGEERWSVVKAMPVFDEEGRVRMAVSILRDVTEQMRAEEAMREVREAERARVARDLHDGVLQDLSYSAVSMGLIMLKAEGTDLAEDLQKAIDTVRHAAHGLRDAVNDLRLEEMYRPLPELVGSLVERSRSMDPRCDIRLEAQEGFPAESLGDVGVELSRVIQEALTNVRRHSAARNVLVSLAVDGDGLVTEVIDDGRGYDLKTPPGTGLRGMRERAIRLGGSLQVESAPGEGTRVRVRVPKHIASRGAPGGETENYGEGR